jgi:pimeloyl-ACP methyl ester carboxylesterase
MLTAMEPPLDRRHGIAPLVVAVEDAPPDLVAEPDGYIVVADDGTRLHFLDWGVPSDGQPAALGGPPEAPGVLLLHGLAQTAWIWAPVARRSHARVHVVAPDLRGHGLSDSPTAGYDRATLVADARAVAEGSGLLAYPGEAGPDRLVVAGHGFGGAIAAWLAVDLGPRCAGLVLVDGGWEDLASTSGRSPGEWLREIEEPPETIRSMEAFLADRAGFDPATWDADQERAARATVVEVPAGRVVSVVRPHALAASVEALFAYDPLAVLPEVAAPVCVLAAMDDEVGGRRRALERAAAARVAAGGGPIRVAEFPADGHNLMRYRPAVVTAAIAGIRASASASGSAPVPR